VPPCGDLSELEFINNLWGNLRNRVGGIDSLESIPGLLKSLKIRALHI
jgi:hypothetical protein